MIETKKPIIFIVEDDPFILRVYERKLAKEGFNVSLSTNGLEAFDRIKETRPDLIVLDLVMPIKDGFELITDLKNNQDLKNIPIVVLTNLRQKKDIERVKLLGVAEYLIKSDNSIQGIVSRIKEVLANSKPQA
ncbi:MAG: response regulator [Patescibacteria group bacterium]